MSRGLYSLQNSRGVVCLIQRCGERSDGGEGDGDTGHREKEKPSSCDGRKTKAEKGGLGGIPLYILCGFTPYLLSPSLGNNVKMNRIKVPGPDKKNNNTHHPDFDESCKRRTRIVKFGMI